MRGAIDGAVGGDGDRTLSPALVHAGCDVPVLGRAASDRRLTG